MKRPIKSYTNKLFSSKAKKERRMELRNSPTKSEDVLWKYLKNKQINGHKFRRQYSIGNFIVDFYCPKLKLAIEVDGANHFFDKKSTIYDTKRQKFIESFGIKIIRVTNTEITYNIGGVLESILGFSKPPLVRGSAKCSYGRICRRSPAAHCYPSPTFYKSGGPPPSAKVRLRRAKADAVERRGRKANKLNK